MTYGHLILIVIGLVALIALWRIVDPASEFSREYKRPSGGESLDVLDQREGNAQPQVRLEEYPMPVMTNPTSMTSPADFAQEGARDVFERECRLADRTRARAEKLTDNPNAGVYLAALREEYKQHPWHSDRAHAIRTAIVELSTAIEKRRQI